MTQQDSPSMPTPPRYVVSACIPARYALLMDAASGSCLQSSTMWDAQQGSLCCSLHNQTSPHWFHFLRGKHLGNTKSPKGGQIPSLCTFLKLTYFSLHSDSNPVSTFQHSSLPQLPTRAQGSTSSPVSLSLLEQCHFTNLTMSLCLNVFYTQAHPRTYTYISSPAQRVFTQA